MYFDIRKKSNTQIFKLIYSKNTGISASYIQIFENT